MAAQTPSQDTIFCAAIEIPSEEERAAYIARACGADAQLRARVERLVAAHFQAGSFLQGLPAFPSDTVDSHPPAGTDGASEPPTTAEAGFGPASARGESPATAIGPYRLVRELGEGGMGTVYLAEQTEPVKRQVALKLIKPGMDSAQIVARFEAERQALALMDHPNIARVLDAGAAPGGRPYFVMELIPGVPITKYCNEHCLTVRQRLELFVSVCRAVQHAHQKGVIHRDLKPSNVLVCEVDGRPLPKVIDFGIAKAAGQQLTERTFLTGMGAVVGTLEYMSPEQAELNAVDVDTRSDVYSLGVVLFELLTGTTPLERRRLKEAGLMEVLRIIREEEPPRPSTRLRKEESTPTTRSRWQRLLPFSSFLLPPSSFQELDWIVMKCLEKDRAPLRDGQRTGPGHPALPGRGAGAGRAALGLVSLPQAGAAEQGGPGDDGRAGGGARHRRPGPGGGRGPCPRGAPGPGRCPRRQAGRRAGPARGSSPPNRGRAWPTRGVGGLAEDGLPPADRRGLPRLPQQSRRPGPRGPQRLRKRPVRLGVALPEPSLSQ